MYISIILPTYNRAHIIEECIQSVLAQSYKDWELLILDDNSSDNTYEIGIRYQNLDSRIQYHKNLIRLNLLGNKNKGLKIAQYPYIFIIEDDLILDKDCLLNLVKSYTELSKNFSVGAIAPRLNSPNPRENIPDKEPFVFRKISGEIWNNYDLDGNFPLETFTLHACSLIPKNIIFMVDGYSSAEYIGNCFREETDFYFRIRAKGYKLFFEPRAQALHKNEVKGGCKLNNEIKTHFYCIRNQWVFSRKFFLKTVYIMFPFFIIQYIYHKVIQDRIRKRKHKVSQKTHISFDDFKSGS